MFKWLRNRIELLKNDRQLALIMLLHIVLIGLYSPQTITAKMKSARERNLCETTEELMAKYAKEKENG